MSLCVPHAYVIMQCFTSDYTLICSVLAMMSLLYIHLGAANSSLAVICSIA